MVTVPGLLGDLIKRLAVGRIELDIVAHLNARRALSKRLQRLCPDLVIIGLRENETDTEIGALLAELPSSKFIALSSDGRSIMGYELRLSQIKLSDLSPEVLVNFIGGSASNLDG